MTIIADEIKPAVARHSDFFSWQLYRWVKKYPERTRVWAATWNSATGVDREHPVLVIGSDRDESWIMGAPLSQLCAYGAKIESYAYGGAHDTANWVDVTEAFWSDYRKKGVCAIHGDLAHEWEYSEDRNTRVCVYCGKHESKKIVMRPVEIWA